MIYDFIYYIYRERAVRASSLALRGHVAQVICDALIHHPFTSIAEKPIIYAWQS